MIDTPEARELYHRIRAEDYPSMEELKAHPVVQQLDALSDYYSSLYGKTSDIDTEERNKLRKQIMNWFLSLCSLGQNELMRMEGIITCMTDL